MVAKTAASEDEEAYFMATKNTTFNNVYVGKAKVIKAKRSAVKNHPWFVEVTEDTVKSTADSLEKKKAPDPGLAFKTQQRNDKLKAQLAAQKQALV